MSRGLVPGAVLVTTPKFALFEEQQVVFGAANCVRLKRLKTSTRNSRLVLPSWSSTRFLNAATSKLLTPSARKLESTRDSLPNVKSAGAVKHAVLNQLLSRAAPLEAADLSHPGTTFGREPAPKRVVSFA